MINLPTTIDSWRSFFYRRFAPLITCEIKLAGSHPLQLDNKFQVNSLQDVFCHPFYWQVYALLDRAPGLVIDLGAHCGHFSMLADLCIQMRFGEVRPEYVLVEPNPELVPVIRRNLLKSGLCSHHTVKKGLVGSRSGKATLWVSRSNYLSASLRHEPSTRGIPADYFDLEQVVGERQVDLLKVDIEGAEYDFVENYPKLLQRVQKLMIEIHAAPESHRTRLQDSLYRAGLRLHGSIMDHGGYQLAAFERDNAAL
jgi:FkbM family methyltransferase